jgi:hypothetical protein
MLNVLNNTTLLIRWEVNERAESSWTEPDLKPIHLKKPRRLEPRWLFIKVVN